jgi:hypothetical protein
LFDRAPEADLDVEDAPRRGQEHSRDPIGIGHDSPGRHQGVGGDGVHFHDADTNLLGLR